nr:DUF5690 family protein [Elizabethkingia bruuniana]
MHVCFPKAFTVARYDHLQVLGVDYKIALILLQVLGYATSKFIGIKVISELTPNKRKFYFLGLILMAELALFLLQLFRLRIMWYLCS